MAAPYRHNATPVWMLTPEGPGHDLADDGWHTKCGQPIAGAVTVTWAQMHVWLGHRVCTGCFDFDHRATGWS